MAERTAQLLVRCCLPAERITFRLHPNTNPVPEAQIERVCDERRRLGQVVERKPLYRVLDFQATDDSLELGVVVSDYGENLALQQHPERTNGALAVCGVCRCPEGYLIEQRSLKVAAAPGLLHLAPAGTLEPGETVLDCLHREALEELGLEPDEMDVSDCIGMLRVDPVGVYQILVPFRTPISLAQIESRPRADSWESEKLFTAPAETEYLLSWIQNHRARMTPASVVALGRHLEIAG